jgi:cytochrome c oxidase subunit II
MRAARREHVMTSSRWILLAVLAAASMAGATPEAQERRVIRVSAERFAFTPSRIEVDAGEEVELRIKSDDTSHGFRIVGLDTNVAIPKRGKGEVTVPLRIDKPGRYVFECNRMCGAGHNFMRGELVVRERQAGPVSR